MTENAVTSVGQPVNEVETLLHGNEERYARRNWLAFFFDYVLFGLALSVLNPNTTLPAFVARLTDSKVLIGLVGAIWFGGWLLPQLFAANYMSAKAKKLPTLIAIGWLGRPFFLLFALFLLWNSATDPTLTLSLFLLGFIIFVVTDSVAALAYFDLIGKVMSAERRSRMFGAAQAVRGVITIAIGWQIQRIMSEQGPGFPANYAAVFGLAGLFLMLALAASYCIVEPPGGAKAAMTRWRDFLPQLVTILRHDRIFVHITLVRLLAGLHMLAASFYVIFATQVAGQPEAAVALFFTAQTIGGALAGLLFGAVAARLGTRRVVQLSATCDLLAIGLALTLALTGAPQTLAWFFPLIFGLLGMIESAMMLGYFNYVLDIAPETERATYIGLSNTLAGALAIAPLVGGWILEQTSYTVLFGLAAVVVLPAVMLAWSLPKLGSAKQWNQ
jgi:hypothetical protein